MTVAIRDAGDTALLIDLDDVVDPQVNARAIAIAGAIRDAAVPGVTDVVPTIRSVGVYFNPLVVDAGRLSDLVERACDARGLVSSGAHIDVPVAYGGAFGPDLTAVARYAGVPEGRVVELHAERDYRVFMLGFLPGFPYLGVVDARIAAPRHQTARRRVPSGSVGIAGQQTGIYPRDSPGGWQIVGRTPLAVFDHRRTPPGLFAPGDTVRFVPMAARDSAVTASVSDAPDDRREGDEAGSSSGRRVTVVRPGLLTTVQDAGRWGHQASGVSVAGPLDPFSYRLANALVGNARDAAALEVTLAGLELRFEDDAQVAVTGADLTATIDSRPLPMNGARACRAGSVLRFAARRHGTRAYVAFDGGVLVPLVLGSRATHLVSRLGGFGGRALKAGDTIVLGLPRGNARRRTPFDIPPLRGETTLRVLAGPQHAYLPSVLEPLADGDFEVARDSDRMGYRLQGRRLPADAAGTMISAPTFTGAIQVPPSGEPMLLMVDRQTTGGYPQVATVISADLPRAGQLAPGDRVRFAFCTRTEALAALVRQEGVLLAVE